MVQLSDHISFCTSFNDINHLSILSGCGWKKSASSEQGGQPEVSVLKVFIC